MKIVIAPDSFKGTYTAEQVATAIVTGVQSAGGEPVCVPGADEHPPTVLLCAAPAFGTARLTWNHTAEPRRFRETTTL